MHEDVGLHSSCGYSHSVLPFGSLLWYSSDNSWLLFTLPRCLFKWDSLFSFCTPVGSSVMRNSVTVSLPILSVLLSQHVCRSSWGTWAVSEYLSVASQVLPFLSLSFSSVLGKIWERFGAHLEKSWFEKSSCRMANTQDISEKFQALEILVTSFHM